MKTKLFLTLYCIACILFAANAQSSKPNVEGTWKIKTLKDGAAMKDMSTKETTVEINTKGKTILVYVGCNRMNASFEFITADQVRPFQVSATRKKCNDEMEALESATRYALEQTNSVRKNGARIEFFKDNTLYLVMERLVDNGKHKKK